MSARHREPICVRRGSKNTIHASEGAADQCQVPSARRKDILGCRFLPFQQLQRHSKPLFAIESSGVALSIGNRWQIVLGLRQHDRQMKER